NNWDFHDSYWQNYTYAKGGPRETMADYFRTHTLGQAAHRLYLSVQLQFIDLFGAGGTQLAHPAGAVLHPILVGLLLPALLRLSGRREHWGFHLGLAVTLLTSLWVYPIVRSPRYFAPLIPAAVASGLAGLRDVAALPRRPCAAGAAVLGLFLAMFAV